MGISANLMRLGWLVLLSCLLAGCKAISAADSADDTKQWQGTWKLVACTYDGEPQMADMEWIVDGDHYNIRLNGQLHEDPNRFKLDATRKQIDVFHHETPPGTYGGKLKGIYEINGDSLIVCYDLTGQGYPKSFDAKRGSRQVLYQFRRSDCSVSWSERKRAKEVKFRRPLTTYSRTIRNRSTTQTRTDAAVDATG